MSERTWPSCNVSDGSNISGLVIGDPSIMEETLSAPEIISCVQYAPS